MKEDHVAEEVASVQASLQKALAQLHVKRRRGTNPGIAALVPGPRDSRRRTENFCAFASRRVDLG